MLIAAGLLAAGVALLFGPLLVIRVDTDGGLTSDPADVSHHQVALVLGAGLTAKGTPTWFLADRLDAAIRLYRLGKVDGLLMSGDNHVASHDEPTAMRTYAIAHVQTRPLPISERSELPVPPGLEAIVMQLLEKDPADRIQSAQALGRRLRALELTWPPERAEQWWETNLPDLALINTCEEISETEVMAQPAHA